MLRILGVIAAVVVLGVVLYGVICLGVCVIDRLINDITDKVDSGFYKDEEQ